MTKSGLLFAMPAAIMTLSGSAFAASTSVCTICTDNAPLSALIAPARLAHQANGWKFRSRLYDTGFANGDPNRVRRVTSLTRGDDASAMMLKVERYYSNRRKPVEQINLPTDRMRRSMFELGYGVSPTENEKLGFSVSSGVERRRLGFAALRGKWSNTRSMGVHANWTHADHWRLSTSYSVDQAQNPRTGMKRGIQLAAGAPPSETGMAVAVDYSPSFLSADNIRIGLEARANRLSNTDAEAYAVHSRSQQSLAMKVSMPF